jgi:hypothetical protein
MSEDGKITFAMLHKMKQIIADTEPPPLEYVIIINARQAAKAGVIEGAIYGGMRVRISEGLLA